jgi:hypothetical protein
MAYQLEGRLLEVCDSNVLKTRNRTNTGAFRRQAKSRLVLLRAASFVRLAR